MSAPTSAVICPDCIAPDEHLEYLVEQPEGIFINPEDRYEEEEYDG